MDPGVSGAGGGRERPSSRVTMTVGTVGRTLRSRLASLVAACLQVPIEEVDPQTPLARYGLDSLGAEELTAAIEEAFDRRVPESLLLDCPDLASLERFLTADGGGDGHSDEAPTDAWDRMRADGILPVGIRPGPRRPRGETPGAVLLTGATGFVGAHVLRALLETTEARVHCLVRPIRGHDGSTRVRRALESFGIWEAPFAERVALIEGDVGRPGLGLPLDRLDALGREVDAVYHCAATVNWVAPYARLRDVNVGGTRELLRLACRPEAKPFHFVSSLAVCYSTRGPAVVREADDPLSWLGGLHLGYAQSKAVAESLVHEAGARGLPVTIYRPSLVSGDSRSGVGTRDDVFSALVKGCIEMGAAPDLDWVVDACPVDHVAAAIVRLSQGYPGPGRVFTLVNPRPRSWRECVLWLNVHGYAVRLVPYAAWQTRLEAEAREPSHPLHALRPFFLDRPAGAGGLTVPQLYETGRRSRVDDEGTRAALRTLALDCPPLSASLLERYVRAHVDRGFLPAVPRRPRPSRATAAPPPLDARFFQRLLRRHGGDAALRVTAVTPRAAGSAHSILTELTAGRSGRTAGLGRYRLAVTSPAGARSLDVVVKTKAIDAEVIEVGGALARLCGDATGRAYKRFRRRLGLTACHRRELAVYGLRDDGLRRHMPVVYGRVADGRRGCYRLVLEDLSGLTLLDTADDVSGWTPPHVEAVLRGLAEIHAVWYRRGATLRRRSWLGPVLTARDMARMRPLWRALAEHAADEFAGWAGSDMRGLQRALGADVGRWWRELEARPATLIHNDFNPRNLALRPTDGGFRLCAYDWELATLGAPQHDLAELLCFVLTEATPRDEVLHYVETHRAALARVTRQPIDPADWRRGVRLSLQDLLINRFAMYALVHRVRRQAFLSRVIRTWRALYDLFPARVESAGG